MIFGSVGIGRAQTARLSITNIANVDSLRAGACEVALGFVDGDNQLLLPAVRVALGGSRSTHLDVSINNPDLRPGRDGGISNPDLRPGRHMSVRAVVGVLSGAPGTCDSIVGSVEIFDRATGATQAVVSPLVYSGFNPQPDIPGFVGIPGGQ
jgi:hypothetical protein